jgi:hypothetical protein
MDNLEYERLKEFFYLYLEWYVPSKYKSKNSEVSPAVFIKNLEESSLSKAKQGIRMAVNDIVESTSCWTPETVYEADDRFKNAGTLTLSEIRKRYWKGFSKAIKRGKILSESEYFLLKGIVEDGDADISAEERLQAEILLSNFEKAYRAR